MKKTALALFLLSFILSKSFSQDNYIKRQQDFIALTDSLFIEGKYGALTEICRKEADSKLQEIANLNLVAVYYRLGDTAASYTMLEWIMSKYDSGASTIIGYEIYGLYHFWGNPTNRKKLLQLMLDKYEHETVTQPKLGKELIKLYLNDQYIRVRHSFYVDSLRALGYVSKYNTDTAFIEDDNENLTAQFLIYKQYGRLFSQEEVGSIFGKQFLLFAHESDPKRREYYLQLLGEAVERDVCVKDRLLSFTLRSMEMQDNDGAFFDNLEHHVDSVKKAYSMPDYTYSVY